MSIVLPRVIPPKKPTQTNSQRPFKWLHSSELTETLPEAASLLPLKAPGSIQNSNTMMVDVQASSATNYICRCVSSGAEAAGAGLQALHLMEQAPEVPK